MLKIIISPAKKMNRMEEAPVGATMPGMMERTEALKDYLRSLDYAALKNIWKCNDKIAAQNYERLRDMDLNRRLTPAVFAYEGIQYQSMAPVVFDREQLDYIGEHLYILSGFYGLLRAFDGVVPYRLEMQARLSWEREDGIVTSLYDYWGNSLYRCLTEKIDSPVTIVNLASKEYSRAVEPWTTPGTGWVDCVFGELETAEDGTARVRVKATAAKMARGSMVRFMAGHQVKDVEGMKAFDDMGYHYQEALSDARTLVFAVSKQNP